MRATQIWVLVMMLACFALGAGADWISSALADARFDKTETILAQCRLTAGSGTVKFTILDVGADTQPDLDAQCTGAGAPAACCTGSGTGNCDRATESAATDFGGFYSWSSANWPGMPSTGNFIFCCDDGATPVCDEFQRGGFPEGINVLLSRPQHGGGPL